MSKNTKPSKTVDMIPYDLLSPKQRDNITINK